MTKGKKPKCLTCDRESHTRGLCSSCYQAALGAIHRDEYTEQQLIDAGLIKPVQPPPRSAWAEKAHQTLAQAPIEERAKCTRPARVIRKKAGEI